MDTLVRNTSTFRHSHRRSDGYEPLNTIGDHNRRRRDGGDHLDHHDHDHGHGGGGSKRTFSKPRSTHKQHKPMMMSSFSYRRNRARQRQIFLQTYKLSSMDASRKSRIHPKLKRIVVKVKTVVISVLSFMRADALKSCNSGSAICASSPSRIVKIC